MELSLKSLCATFINDCHIEHLYPFICLENKGEFMLALRFPDPAGASDCMSTRCKQHKFVVKSPVFILCADIDPISIFSFDWLIEGKLELTAFGSFSLPKTLGSHIKKLAHSEPLFFKLMKACSLQMWENSNWSSTLNVFPNGCPLRVKKNIPVLYKAYSFNVAIKHLKASFSVDTQGKIIDF